MVKKFSRQNFKKKQNKSAKDPNNSNIENNLNNYDSDEEIDFEEKEKLMKEITDGYIILQKVIFIKYS